MLPTTCPGAEDATTSRPSPDSQSASALPDPGSSVGGDPWSLVTRSLRNIFESLAVQPDFHRHYERDPARRLYASWARVGNAMQLALGNPVTLFVTHPDGRRTTHVVVPDVFDEEYQAALRQVREMAPDTDGGTPADSVSIRITEEQAENFMARVKEAVRSDSGR